jgi:hypothetical protein
MRLRRLREAGELVTRMVDKSLNQLYERTRSMAEREVLLDAVFVCGMDEFRASEAAAALGALALAEVPSARLAAQDLAGTSDFEPLSYRFLRFDAFGTSHKFRFFRKRARTIGKDAPRRK